MQSGRLMHQHSINEVKVKVSELAAHATATRRLKQKTSSGRRLITELECTENELALFITYLHNN